MTAFAARTDVGPDMSLFAAFYDDTARQLYRYLHRATAGDRRVVEDLVQETYMAVVQSFRNGHPDAITMPWMMGIARHKLMDHHRRVARESRKLAMAHEAEGVFIGGSEFDDIDAAEALHLLQRLSAAHRLVLMLRYVDDLAVADVARLMNLSVRATESLIVRARRALEAHVREARGE